MTTYLVIALSLILGAICGYMFFGIRSRNKKESQVFETPFESHDYYQSRLATFGLTLYTRPKSVHAYQYPHDARYDVTFLHPDYVFNVEYDFHQEHAFYVQNSYVNLANMINLSMDVNYPESHFKAMNDRVEEFARKHDIKPSTELLTPLLYAFGANSKRVLQALESGVHPAVIAVLVKSVGEEIVEILDSLKDMPIEWLSNIYGFTYVEKYNAAANA